MGFFDEIGGLVSDFKQIGDEFSSVKDDLVSSVIGAKDDVQATVDDTVKEFKEFGQQALDQGAEIKDTLTETIKNDPAN